MSRSTRDLPPAEPDALTRGAMIRVRGARQHNLKGIDLDIPRHCLVVMTGVSGSGKSSLAFDTLYAEGQRRYVQSLSAYARQFIERLDKPDVDFIDGLSPAVAIEQAHSLPNPRSTIATVTEIHDYLRVLYAVAGVPHDPATGERLHRMTSQDMGGRVLALPEGSRVMILAPAAPGAVAAAGGWRGWFDQLRRQGFVRARVGGTLVELDEAGEDWEKSDPDSEAEVVVDRVIVRESARGRLMESIEAALHVNPRELRAWIDARDDATPETLVFTTAYANPRTGFLLEKLTPQHFSFNTRAGACPCCGGTGVVTAADPGLIVPDEEKSLSQGAVKSWWSQVPRMRETHERWLRALASHFGAALDQPFRDLPQAFKTALFEGTGDQPVPTGWKTADNRRSLAKPFEGLLREAERLMNGAESEALRARVARFMGTRTCPECGGRRLRPEALAVLLPSSAEPGWLGIDAFCGLTIEDAAAWIRGVETAEDARQIPIRDLVVEVAKRLAFLNEVGLGYLTLDRESGTLSGGEMQRIRLAAQLGAGLAGVLYVLDEPSIGLHPADTTRLVASLRSLCRQGNTVLVVEHDEAMLRAADWMIELGPGAGELGGRLVAQGDLPAILAHPESVTGDYLAGRKRVQVPPSTAPLPLRGDLLEREGGGGWLTVHGATARNLQNVTTAFPLGCLTCVTGPSGSGKSTLVEEVLTRALMRHFYSAKAEPGAHERLGGLGGIDKLIVIDQSPIGRSPRSNPATFTGVLTPLRELFAKLPASRLRGYDAGRFSFNTPGGRCEKCQGDGRLKVEMHFLADVFVTCDACGGRRYNAETLEVTFKGRSIADVLEMTVADALALFEKVPPVASKLAALVDTGLGYIRLGQAGNTLSGGEAQRVKLAAELGKRATGRTLFILDEPTTGLHFADIQKLMETLARLRDAGNTVIVVEHHLDVIRCADWVIDLGPGGGSAGGRVVAEGPPAQITRAPESLTGRFLRDIDHVPQQALANKK
jgi:excinuclease ABC subunit A